MQWQYGRGVFKKHKFSSSKILFQNLTYWQIFWIRHNHNQINQIIIIYNYLEMSTFMLNEDEDNIPVLVPIKKKQGQKIPTVSPTDKGEPIQDNTGRFIDQTSKMVTPQGKDTSTFKNITEEKKKEPDFEKIKNFQRKFKENTSTAQKKDIEKEQNLRSKQNQKSKSMIHEMLNRLSVKNLTQELYPMTNETIDKSINEIEEQIREIKKQIKAKEDKLAGNESNKQANRQLDKLKRSVNHCQTIKELYYQKINQRNRVGNLQSQIVELKKQNKDLRIKITKGIQNIENYKKNLPSDEQKQLKEKLAVCTKDLEREKQMRMNLEKNIQNIIMNFKRLYDEADTSRVIITTKLKEIEERERILQKNKLQKIEQEKQQFHVPFKRSPTNDATEEKKYFKRENDGEQSTYRKNFQQEKRMKSKREEQKISSGRVTMEQQIKKMRSNQAAFSRLH